MCSELQDDEIHDILLSTEKKVDTEDWGNSLSGFAISTSTVRERFWNIAMHVCLSSIWADHRRRRLPPPLVIIIIIIGGGGVIETSPFIIVMLFRF